MSSFTKDAIKMTFVSLLDQKPLNQITVKMVVEECGINRNSFYYHFQDIPALLEEIIMDHLEQFVRKYPTIDSAEASLHELHYVVRQYHHPADGGHNGHRQEYV